MNSLVSSPTSYALCSNKNQSSFTIESEGDSKTNRGACVANFSADR